MRWFRSAAERDRIELEAETVGRTNPLDRAIAWAFPGWAVRRSMARSALRVKALSDGYDAARSNRLRRQRAGKNASADSLLAAGQLEEMRERARDLVRNDALGRSIMRALVDNVVGKGIAPVSRVDAAALGITEAQATEFEDAADRVWQRWAPHAMADGRSIEQGVALAMRKLVEDGEALALPIMSTQVGRPYETALQIIEADRLDDPAPGGEGEQPDRARLRLGVEIGDEGQPEAYWIADRHPGDLGFGAGASRLRRRFRRIAARDEDGARNVYHVFDQLRPGQSRGVPLLAAVTNDLQDLADIMEAEREGQRAAACFAAFVRKDDPQSAARYAAASTNEDGQRLEELEPGIIEYLAPGEDITFANAQRPGSTWARFVEILVRRIGAANGLPYELLGLDFSKTNYSSYRGAAIEAWRGFECWQALLVRELLAHARFEVLREAWLKGELPSFVGDFTENRALWLAAEWNGPRRQSVDPTKDAQNSQIELELGLTSRQIECARRGLDWERILDDEIAFELLRAERRAAAGLDAAPRQPAPPSGEDEPEDDELEDEQLEDDDELEDDDDAADEGDAADDDDEETEV